MLTWGQYFSADSAIGPTQYGMAIMTGTSVSIVNAPSVPGQTAFSGDNSPVFPVLQAEDGSFIGSYQTNMVAFDQAGNVRWMVPNEYPLIATPGGGTIGQSGISYDPNGSATGQSGNPSGVPAWDGQIYDAGASAVQLSNSWVSFAAGFWSVDAGNPSGNEASIANLGKSEGLPLWLYAKTPACKLGSDKPSLGGAALNQYVALRQQLLSFLSALTPTSSCSIFFNGISAPNLSQLSTAVSNQVPYDGLLSNLNRYAAGLWTQKSTLLVTWPKFPVFPVCSEFFQANGNWS